MGPQVSEVRRLGGGEKNNPRFYMQSYDPAIRGTLSRDYWMVAKYVFATAKVNLARFDESRIRSRLGGLPHFETFTWQSLTTAEKVTRSGRPGYPSHPTYHINAIKLKRETIWRRGLPHLPGVPHRHVIMDGTQQQVLMLSSCTTCQSCVKPKYWR